jgi:outer membrane protein assembly factor BamB
MRPYTRRIDPELGRFLISTCRALAVVAAVFSVAMATLLIANYAQMATLKPSDNAALTALREQYRSAQDSEELATKIRTLDLAVRRAYFTRQWQTRTAGYLLISGVVLLLVCLRAVSALTRSLPQAKPQTVEAPLAFPRGARVGLTVLGCVFLAGAVVSAVLGDGLIRKGLPVIAGPAQGAAAQGAAAQGAAAQSMAAQGAAAGPESGTTAAAAQAAQSQEYKKNWPQFRGPDGLGIAPQQDPPVDWDGKSGRNIAWKAEVPVAGRSSPVVWGNKLFLSGADQSAREVFCWDTGSGKLLWRTKIPAAEGTPSAPPRVTDTVGYAPSTMAVNGKQAFAVFATGDLTALDLEGKVLWTRHIGTPGLNYGYASSLALLGDGVVAQFDQEENGRIVAFRGADGSVRWDIPRQVLGSWATPALIEVGGKPRLMIHGTPYLTQYDPENGKQVWRLGGMMGENAPSPAFFDGRIFVSTQLLSLVAVDARSGKKLWEVYDDLPDVASPLASGGLVLMTASFGVVTCLDAEKGDTLWRQEFPTGFYASPILAGGRFYTMDRSGVMRIYAASKSMNLIGSPALGENVEATPAFLDSAIFVRGARNLYCIRAGRS